jgi:Tol biopolymer transport system component
LTQLEAITEQPELGTAMNHITQLTNDTLAKVSSPLLTDGVRVFFREDGPSGRNLAAVSVAGGGTGPVPLPAGFQNVFDLSPSTSELLVGRRVLDQEALELWVVPMIGGSPRRIGNLLANSASWSPNRHQIAYGLQHRLFVANANGSEQRKLAEVSGNVGSPSWSPDGKRLRFSENWNQNDDVLTSLWEVKTDGTSLRRVLNGWNIPPHECCGAWTQDGGFFVFQSTRGGRTDLWAISERKDFFKGSSEVPVRLTSGGHSYSFPAMSLDGKQIFALGVEKRGELVRYDANLKEFVPFLKGVPATWVSFSRSNNSVAYINYPDLTVWRAKRDGGERSQITFSPLEADGLSWSPDEKWLAMRGRMPGKPWNIYLVPSGGGEAKALIPGEGEQAIPTWSADGKRIAFGDVPTDHGKAKGTEAIHILQLSDQTVTELAGSRGMWTARWSPDGRFLSALTIDGSRLMLYDFKTEKWRSTDAKTVDNPTWSRDGKYIYFDTEGTDKALRRVDVADGHVDQLADLRAYSYLAWWWSGVAPDNSPLILRNLGSTEIYSLTLDSR